MATRAEKERGMLVGVGVGWGGALTPQKEDGTGFREAQSQTYPKK